MDLSDHLLPAGNDTSGKQTLAAGSAALVVVSELELAISQFQKGNIGDFTRCQGTQSVQLTESGCSIAGGPGDNFG